MTYALRTEGLTKCWGQFRANDGISLAFPVGLRHALIGPNGAGKTTFVNLITGVYPPTGGDVFLGEERVTALAQHERVKRGMARTFQINTLFPGLTVLESVVLAICERKGVASAWLSSVASRKDECEEARNLLRSLHLEQELNTLTRELAYGKQRLVEIALGLATKPKVLILDEPGSGIPAQESAAVFHVIAALPSDVTVLFIEHDMDLVLRFAQRVTVLVAGKTFAEGTPEEIARDPRVREIYLGDIQDD